MIPARLGSTRVKNKNLRLINGKPLIQYIIDSAKKSKYLDEIYINSEAKIFEEISKNNKINFYKRNKELSTNTATNDDFTLDFFNSVKCDILIQLLPTSPFISSDEIDSFIEKMINDQYDTMISIKNIQIESIYKNKPINFNQKENSPPSQNLEPIKAYACGIMGWRPENFNNNIKKYSSGYHGGDGKIGYYELKGFSVVDIDNEEDFILAESISKTIDIKLSTPLYYEGEKYKEIFDSNVPRILKKDGVSVNNQDSFNKETVDINELIKKYGREKSWSHTIINSESNSATLIGQLPGEGNRMHYHHNWDEWWFIIEGEWDLIIEDEKKKIKHGEIIYIPRNNKHKITAYGEKMAIRLAVSRYDVDHVYVSEDY